jgi:DNA-directed RNA polymerase subunit M/transcription elongation factor TFIIS
MKFCSKCENMTYISINEKDPNIINYYCRMCGHVDNSNENLCILNTKYSKNITNINVINQYTKFDPTLPHLYNIDCINSDCKSNVDNKVRSDIIYIRYDNANLKNVYLCTHCNTSWNTNQI